MSLPFGLLGAGFSTLGGGRSIPSWVMPGAAIDMNFAQGLYFGGALSSLATCARSAPATSYAPNAAGVLVPFAANAFRITNLGLLVEEGRTNYAFNSGGTNAGTTPTDWGVAQGCGGIDPSAWSSGTDAKNYGYAQFTVNGTTNSTSRLLITPIAHTIGPGTFSKAVSPGDVLTFSYNAFLVGGSYPGFIRADFRWYDSGGLPLTISGGAQFTPTTTPTRQSDTATAPASAAYVLIMYDFNGPASSGLSVNFTMAVGGIQLEVGSFATSYILTTSTSVARSADVITTAGALKAAFAAAQGSLVASGAAGNTGANPRIVAGVAAASLLNIQGSAPGGSGAAQMFDGSNNLQTANTADMTTTQKYASSWSASGRSLVLANGTVATDANTDGDISSSYFGSQSDSAQNWDGFIKRISVWGSRLTNAQLKALTA